MENDKWWAYVASFDKGPGAVRVNLGLRGQIPLKGFKYLVITGVSYSTSRQDGLPDSEEVGKLNKFLGMIVEAVGRVTPAVYVGTFTHACEQLHYFYIAENAEIEQALRLFYENACSGVKTYINVRMDASWSAYTDFLYPSYATLEFYRDEIDRLGITL